MIDFNNIEPLSLGIGYNPKEAMNTPLIRGLINALVRETGGPYLEIGTYRGASLAAAAHDNPEAVCVGVDNFSQFDRDGDNEPAARRRIAGYENVVLLNMDYRHYFEKVITREKMFRVYFFDGPHTFAHQLDGLELALPFLHPDAYIIVDDTNWREVAGANEVFRTRHGWEVVFEKRTGGNGSEDWWNGIQVMKKRQR